MPAPTGLNIPAMTTDAERECYYRLAKEAGPGAVIELGAWMGASTAYIAAGLRDRDSVLKAQVYDYFRSKPGHIGKVKAFYKTNGIDKVPVGPCLDSFKDNLGDLMAYVEPHQGKIEAIKWSSDPIALLVTDAPKRVPAISAVMTALRKGLQPGSIMAWQDFCHFPSYEIPACLYRLRDHIEFVEAVVPGTTLVFRVKSQWSKNEASLAAFDLGAWSPEEIEQAWLYWRDFVAPEKKALFDCGQPMFLCDLGFHQEAVQRLKGIYAGEPASIVKKWRYLREARPDFVTRYAPLFQYLERQGVFAKEAA
jgi:hypothetical protein